MCGLAGFVDFSSRSTQENLLTMMNCIIHRGPDDSGFEFVQHKNYSLGIGFRRLSIIDLSPSGHQPMRNADGSLTITLNGEIYNYKEIKKELLEKGIKFNSNSDTEVILYAYLLWGRECVKKFIGMFVFVIYDRTNEQILICRDRAGVKPLYYYFNNDLFIYGSELKVFHKHQRFTKKIDHNALSLYFQHGYIPAPHSVFQNTHKLLPGHWLIVKLESKEINTEKYWDVTDAYNKPKQKISYDDALEETEKILRSACEYRMVADVPVGVFLSGGYDSSLVSALLQSGMGRKLKTFTIGFEDEAFNESVYAGRVAQHLGTEHHEYTCTYKEAMDIIPNLPEMYDEPFADSSAIPTFLVSKMARQKVTVALSADGGDETFAGYTKYEKALHYISRLNAMPGFGKSFASLPLYIAKIFSGKNLSSPDRVEKLKLIIKSKHPVEAFNIITQSLTVKEVKQMLAKNFQTPPTAFDEYGHLLSKEMLDNFLWLDYKTYLVDDILTKVDRATMAVSLEGREPLLDHRIIEWVASLPSEYKLKNGVSKILVHDIVHKYIPGEFMERPKMGFRIPIEKWFRNEQRELLIHFLSKEKIEEFGLLSFPGINNLLQTYFKKDIEDFHRIWKILMLQMWCSRWID